MESWARTLELVAAAPDTGEALAELLHQAIPAGGALAGAVLGAERCCCRAAEGFDVNALDPLLSSGGSLTAVLASRDSWPDIPFWLSQSIVLEHGVVGQLAIVPMRLRGVAIGGLLLVYGDRAALASSQAESLTALAGLAALLLDHDQLYEEARRARQARDHFLTAINHELRTPATAVMLNAGLLSSGFAGELPPRLARTVHSLESDVEELVRVMERVLDLGRLEAASQPGRGDVIDPRAFVIDLLRRVEPSAKRKGLSVAVHVPRSLPSMQTDVQRVSRILLHLVGNAIKYTEHGGIEVRVERATATVGGRRGPILIVRIVDTGCGIPPAEIERIFEPFAQVEEGARTDSSTRGIGLGLPLARKLAQSLGGDVLLESSCGQGTVATLQLPYRRPAGA